MANYPTKLFGIVGYPLGHSMSPGLHNWGFREVGFPGVYLAWSEPPEKLKDFFRAVRLLPILGGNITIPHKVEAMKLVDKVSERAAAIGAINTFYWKGEELWGENTDVIGFLAPLKGRSFKKALLLGAGGVSRAVIAGLKDLGVPEIIIANRTLEKAQALADHFHIKAIPWDERMKPEADLIINATSQGMKGEQVDKSPYEEKWLEGRKGLVYDIVYNPLETLLLRESKAAGWETVTGLTMFVEQARAAFALWTGGVEMPQAPATAKVKELLGL